MSEFVDRYQNLELFLEGTKGSPSSVRFARGQQTAARFVRKSPREVRTPLSTTTRQQGQALQGLYDWANGYRSTAATCLYRNGSDRGWRRIGPVAPGVDTGWVRSDSASEQATYGAALPVLPLLSQKAREASLTPAERADLDEFIRVADLLAILQSAPVKP